MLSDKLAGMFSFGENEQVGLLWPVAAAGRRVLGDRRCAAGQARAGGECGEQE